jgi:hypothetical protein
MGAVMIVNFQRQVHRRNFLENSTSVLVENRNQKQELETRKGTHGNQQRVNRISGKEKQKGNRPQELTMDWQRTANGFNNKKSKRINKIVHKGSQRIQQWTWKGSVRSTRNDQE